MAASRREPQDVPLPPSPTSAHAKLTKSFAWKGKGKESVANQKRRTGKAAASTLNPKDSSTSDPTWNWISLTESCPSKVPPVFTKDGSYYFSLVGASVKIYATSTGRLVSTLSAPQASDESSDLLTSVILNPRNVFQIITGSINGFIRVWDYLDATLLKTLDVGQSIHHICAHIKHADYVFITASRRSKHKNQNTDDNAIVLRISLKATDASAQSALQKSSEVTPIGKTRFPTGFSLSPSGAWLVVTAGHKVYVSPLSSLKSGFTKYVSSDRLSCLAFHPTEDYFATGDVKGVIRLWYCLNEASSAKVAGLEKKTQTASFHWHAHAVSSLAFTSNGAYLLSGGEESVLVIWQLHTGKKEFVPRVGAPIQTVSISKGGDGGEEYLLGLTDATYVFVSAATLKISRSYPRIKLGPSPLDNVPSSSRSAPIAVHSLSSTLILPSSHPSSIQVYSPSSAKIISELEVSPSNRVSRRDEKTLEPSRVERTEMSPNGEWLASIDARSGDDDFQGEVYLKIWRWDKKFSSWSLNTRIDRPHGLYGVTDISFSPFLQGTQEFYLVTTGKDGAVKSWRLRSTQGSKDVVEDYWVSRSSFGFQNEIPCHTSWSPDGSLLAVTLGAYVVIYDPMTNAHRATLTSPECRTAQAAHFVGRGRYMAVVGLHDLVLWDMITHTVKWSCKKTLAINALVPHPDNGVFSLFTHEETGSTRVYFFSASSSSPSRVVSLPFSLRSIAWYSLLHTPAFNLVGVSHDWRVVLIGDEVRLPEDEGSSARGIKSNPSQQRRTLFQDIFGKSIFGDIPTKRLYGAPALPRPRQPDLEASSVFDIPAYLAPPMDALFEPLITNFLRRQLEHTISDVGPDDPDEDVEMVDDTAKTIKSSSRPVQHTVEEDMSVFISLFKAQSLNHTTSEPLKINGIGVVNDATYCAPSDTRRTPSQSKPSISHPPLVAEIHSTDLSARTTVINGKKRKKASE